MGSIDNHYPVHQLLRVSENAQWVWPKITSKNPVEFALSDFTDCSSKRQGPYILYTNSSHSSKWLVPSPDCTAQQSKLTIFH